MDSAECKLSRLAATVAKVKNCLTQARLRATGYALRFISSVVTRLRPTERWYSDVLQISLMVTRVKQFLHPGQLDASLTARLLHRFLDILAEDGRRFSIPTRVDGLDILRAAARQSGGLVCCGAHVPFIKLFIPLIRHEVGPDKQVLAVVKYPNAQGGFEVWNDEPIQAVPTGSGTLLYTRSLLRRDGCLLLLADKEQGEHISANIFRFVGKVHSRIVMCFPRLMPDGVILLQVFAAPAPNCRNEDEVRANLEFIAQQVRAILEKGEFASRPATLPPLPPGVSSAQEERELDRIHLYSRRQLGARVRRLEQVVNSPTHTVSDLALYKKRLSLLQRELEIRSRTRDRSEFTVDGRPLPE